MKSKGQAMNLTGTGCKQDNYFKNLTLKEGKGRLEQSPSAREKYLNIFDITSTFFVYRDRISRPS